MPRIRGRKTHYPTLCSPALGHHLHQQPWLLVPLSFTDATLRCPTWFTILKFLIIVEQGAQQILQLLHFAP